MEHDFHLESAEKLIILIILAAIFIQLSISVIFPTSLTNNTKNTNLFYYSILFIRRKLKCGFVY